MVITQIYTAVKFPTGLNRESSLPAFQMLGYCVPKKPYDGAADGLVSMVTELGETIDIIKLLQMSWEDRLRVSYSRESRQTTRQPVNITHFSSMVTVQNFKISVIGFFISTSASTKYNKVTNVNVLFALNKERFLPHVLTPESFFRCPME